MDGVRSARFGSRASGAFAWAFANAALFTLYIVLAHRIARADTRTSSIDRLGAAMLIAGIAITPLGFFDATDALIDPIALAAGIGVGISSSVIPYVFDQPASISHPHISAHIERGFWLYGEVPGICRF